MLSRDRLALIAGLAGPLALTAILVPFRGSFANTDAALALILVVVAVSAAGSRLAGYAAAVSAAVWFDFFLTRPFEHFSISRASDIETTVLVAGHRHSLSPRSPSGAGASTPTPAAGPAIWTESTTRPGPSPPASRLRR